MKRLIWARVVPLALLFLVMPMAQASSLFATPSFLPPAKAFSFHARIALHHILVVQWMATTSIGIASIWKSLPIWPAWPLTRCLPGNG